MSRSPDGAQARASAGAAAFGFFLAFLAGLGGLRRRFGQPQQVLHRVADAIGQHLDVRRAVVVARDAEVEPAVVGEDRHDDPDRADDGHERIGLEHPPSERLDRLLGPGHVGRRRVHVQARRAGHDAAAEREQHRRREARERGQHVAGDRLLALLDAVHLRADAPEPGARVVEPDRQSGEHGRDAVVVDAALAAATNRDGNHRAHDVVGPGWLAARLQQRAEAAGDHRQDHVVDRSAELGADGLDVAEPHLGPAPAPVRADRPRQRGGGDRAHPRARGGRCLGGFDAVASVSRGRASARWSTCTPTRGADFVGERARQHLDVGGLGRRRELAPRAAAGRVGEHHRHQVGGGDPVDHAVVDLREQRPAPVGEALDRPQLPQWLVAVQVLGEDARRHVAQLLLAARLGDRGVAEVVVEAEVRVVNPRGRAGAERHEAHLLAVARNQVELARDHLLQVLERRWRPLEEAHAADVHRRHVVLDVKERGVDRAHPFHTGSPLAAGL